MHFERGTSKLEATVWSCTINDEPFVLLCIRIKERVESNACISVMMIVLGKLQLSRCVILKEIRAIAVTGL